MTLDEVILNNSSLLFWNKDKMSRELKPWPAQCWVLSDHGIAVTYDRSVVVTAVILFYIMPHNVSTVKCKSNAF